MFIMKAGRLNKKYILIGLVRGSSNIKCLISVSKESGIFDLVKQDLTGLFNRI